MHYLKPTLTALILVSTLLAAGSVARQRAPDRAPAAAGAPPAHAKPLPPKPPPRRSVPQVIATMPAPPPVATEGYRPSLAPGPAASLPSRAAPAAGPVHLNSCDPGGCTDSGALRYNGGVGNAAVGPQGQLCTRSPAGMQCF
jgi:hypothetical protein